MTSFSTLMQHKQNRKPITMLTAYDCPTASLIDQAGIDIILVGDSLGNVIQGQPNTLSVTLDHLIYHTTLVARGVQHAMIVADMPFLSHGFPLSDTCLHAGQLIQAGAQAVKIEVLDAQLDHVRAVVDMGIPVMGHIGFTPQFLHRLGGYKVQGRTNIQAQHLLKLAVDLVSIGCFSILLEMVPLKLAQSITEQVAVPTIGIGAGPYCDGQVLVTHDVLGLSTRKPPSFVKPFADLHTAMMSAITDYKMAVQTRQFPDNAHSFDA